MCNSTDMQELCENMWQNYFKEKVRGELLNSVGFYKAKVISVDLGTLTATIQRPFESSTITLPCTDSSANRLSAEDMCIVLTFGDLSNAVVLARADFSTL